MQRDSGRLAGATVSSAISMIETIKAGGAEIDFFEKTAGYEAGYNNSAVFLLKQNAYLRTIPVLLHKLGMCVILMMGVELVFSGKFYNWWADGFSVICQSVYDTCRFCY